MASKRTVVRGVRAEREFWERCDERARKENITRNELIIREVSAYLGKADNREKRNHKISGMYYKDANGVYKPLIGVVEQEIKSENKESEK